MFSDPKTQQYVTTYQCKDWDKHIGRWMSINLQQIQLTLALGWQIGALDPSW
jgi:hypothetical protein